MTNSKALRVRSAYTALAAATLMTAPSAFAQDANAQEEAALRPKRPANLQQFAERVATLPLIAEPGTKWSYSIGLDVMGRVIEVALGMPFDRFVQQRLFDPLGLFNPGRVIAAD